MSGCSNRASKCCTSAHARCACVCERERESTIVTSFAINRKENAAANQKDIDPKGGGAGGWEELHQEDTVPPSSRPARRNGFTNGPTHSLERIIERERLNSLPSHPFTLRLLRPPAKAKSMRKTRRRRARRHIRTQHGEGIDAEMRRNFRVVRHICRMTQMRDMTDDTLSLTLPPPPCRATRSPQKPSQTEWHTRHPRKGHVSNWMERREKIPSTTGFGRDQLKILECFIIVIIAIALRDRWRESIHHMSNALFTSNPCGSRNECSMHHIDYICASRPDREWK